MTAIKSTYPLQPAVTPRVAYSGVPTILTLYTYCPTWLLAGYRLTSDFCVLLLTDLDFTKAPLIVLADGPS